MRHRDRSATTSRAPHAVSGRGLPVAPTVAESKDEQLSPSASCTDTRIPSPASSGAPGRGTAVTET
ncbi:hypothetical protein [Streptomyces galbus]|uniref:hypothetical protein n=1 Tax=Streptomyces galbus TaxID=33898 RepID=UPI003EBBDEDE